MLQTSNIQDAMLQTSNIQQESTPIPDTFYQQDAFSFLPGFTPPPRVTQLEVGPYVQAAND